MVRASAYVSGHSTWNDDETLRRDIEERNDLVRDVAADLSVDTEAMLGANDESSAASA